MFVFEAYDKDMPTIIVRDSKRIVQAKSPHNLSFVRALTLLAFGDIAKSSVTISTGFKRDNCAIFDGLRSSATRFFNVSIYC